MDLLNYQAVVDETWVEFWLSEQTDGGFIREEAGKKQRERETSVFVIEYLRDSVCGASHYWREGRDESRVCSRGYEPRWCGRAVTSQR